MYPVTMADDIPREPGIRDFKAHVSDYMGRVEFGGEHVAVRKNGKRAAVLVPVAWYEANGGVLPPAGE